MFLLLLFNYKALLKMTSTQCREKMGVILFHLGGIE